MKNLADRLPVTQKMPVLFIGHGSPLNITLHNGFTRSLTALGKRLPRPKAIMVISAHWLTNGTSVTRAEKPRTIHDFYGFPDELYEVIYPSPGAQECADLAIKTIKKVRIAGDDEWGLDHASWAVLKHMYPSADIPVFEMSLDYRFNEWHPKPLQYHYELATELRPLRTRGVLIMGSGNIVHNLGLADFDDMDAKPVDWAVEFDENVKKRLLDRNYQDLINYRRMGESASLGVPSLDHYLPMIYAAALQEKDEPLTFTHEGFQNGSISMRCFQIG
jgi:4,5-DOPA dioxygenase extradiol